MVIKQEKWLVFCKTRRGQNRKAWKVWKYFLIDFSPRRDFPQTHFHVFLWLIFAFCYGDPHFPALSRFHSFSQMSIWSPVVVETHEYAEMIHLLSIRQTWVLFMAENKNQLTNETDNLETRAQSTRSTAMWLWSTRRLNIEQCFFVSQIHPHNPPTDSNRLIKYSQRHL